MTDTEQTRRTKRRYAHELFPHPNEGQVRPLEVEVKYRMAMALGMDLEETSALHVEPPSVMGDRVVRMILTADIALLADALAQGLGGQSAWDFMALRSHGDVMEHIYERAQVYGVDIDKIKPYPCGPEPDHHRHLGATDARGLQPVTRVDCPESECVACTEEVPE